jgi:hypothetical protein
MTSERLAYHGFSCSFVPGMTGHDDMVTCAHNVSLRFISVIWGQARRRRVEPRGRENVVLGAMSACTRVRPAVFSARCLGIACLFCTFRTLALAAQPYFASSSQSAIAWQPALITGLMHLISLYHESMTIITIRRWGNGCLWERSLHDDSTTFSKRE